jgi:hypothetical protein
MQNGGIGHDNPLHYLRETIQNTMEEISIAPMRSMCSRIWVELEGMNSPSPIPSDLGGSKGFEPKAPTNQLRPNRPCPWCSTAWTQVGKPCKHLYRRLRWERMGTPKDCTVGERPNRSGAHFATQEGGDLKLPLPTFFDIDGSYITRSDRVAYRHYMKRLLRRNS